jgi:hypothetical protein
MISWNRWPWDVGAPTPSHHFTDTGIGISWLQKYPVCFNVGAEYGHECFE